jgi:hypothetical protein
VDSAGGGGASAVDLTVGNCRETLLVVASGLEIFVASQAVISIGVGGLAVNDADGVNSGNTGVSAEVLGSDALDASDGVSLIVIGHAVSDELVTGDQSALGVTLKEVATETSGAGDQRIVGLAGFNDGSGIGTAGLLSSEEESGGTGGADVVSTGDQTVEIQDLLATLEGGPVIDVAGDELVDISLDVEGVALVVNEV